MGFRIRIGGATVFSHNYNPPAPAPAPQPDPAQVARAQALQAEQDRIRAEMAAKENADRIERERLQEILNKEKNEYDKFRNFLASISKTINLTNRIAPIGEKGSGKSTYLYLKGEGPKPIDSGEADSTIQITLTGSHSMDLIGTKITLNRLLRLFAVFMDVGFPNTFILFSNTRIGEDLQVFGHLFIRDLYVCPMVPHLVYTQANPTNASPQVANTYYNQAKIKAYHQATSGIRAITHADPAVPLNGNVQAVETLFPGRRFQIPTFEEYKANPSGLNALRFKIAKYYWMYKNEFGSDQLRFLNAIDVSED